MEAYIVYYSLYFNDRLCIVVKKVIPLPSPFMEEYTIIMRHWLRGYTPLQIVEK